jgi:glucose/arabinose dehydrogenase
MKLKAFLLSLLSCITTAWAQESLELKPIAQGFEDTVALSSIPSEPSKIFVVERGGTVAIVENGKRAKRDLLNIEAILSPQENAGLSGVAFPPHYAQTKEVYVSYTDKQGDTIIGRFPTKPGQTANEDALIVVLKIVQPHPHAHRSTLAFAADDALIIGLGDAPRKQDIESLAQNPRSLFGKILRIGLADPSRYSIPSDNPFAKREDGAPEVWALGVQNPLSLSFDPTTKRMILIDSGREIQELDIVERGKNYGWNIVEGSTCVAATCDKANFTPPIYSYPALARSTAVGGFFYSGMSIPSLQGAYIFADSHSKTLFKLLPSGNTWSATPIAKTSFPIVAVGQGGKGEMYVVTGDGVLSVVTSST